MEDERIVALFWERSENAIAETANKYGRLCHWIAFNMSYDFAAKTFHIEPRND